MGKIMTDPRPVGGAFLPTAPPGPSGPWSQYGQSNSQFANQFNDDALTRWFQAAQKNDLQNAWNAYHPQGAPQPQAPAGGGALGGGIGGGSGGGGGGGGAHIGAPLDQFGAAIAHVNQQYDAQLSNLDRLTGSAKAGTQTVGNETLSRLAALGKDAQKQNKASNKNVRNEFASAKGQQGAAYAALLADLVRQGAQTQGLGSEEAARMSALAGAGARQTAQSDRYSQLLSQSLNERTGLAKQSTQNTMDDLTKALQAAQFAAQQRKADQIYQIEQERAQAEAMARAAAARGGGGRGGGRGGGSGGKTSLSSLVSLLRAGKGKSGGKFDTNSVLKAAGIKLSDIGNKYERGTINQLLNNISGGSNIGGEISHWNNFVANHHGGWNGYNPDDVSAVLDAAYRAKNASRSTAERGIDPKEALALYAALNG